MAHQISSAASFGCDNAGGTFTDISGSVNSVTLNGGNALVDDTGLGDTRHTEINDVDPIMTMQINGFWNSTTEAIFGPVMEGTSVTKTVQYRTISGQYHSGEANVGAVSHSTPVGIQTFSCEFRSSDTAGFTRTSVAVS